MSTRDQIAALIQENLNDSGIFYTPVDINDSLQDGYDEVAAYTGCIQKATTIDIVANQSYYDLATLITDFVAVRGIYNSRIRRWLIPYTYLTLDQMRDDWELSTGEPYHFSVVNWRKIAVYPRLTSTATNGFWIYYYASAPTMAGSDTPTIPIDHQDSILEQYTTADLFEQAEEWTKAQAYQIDYFGELEQLGKLRTQRRLPDRIDRLR